MRATAAAHLGRLRLHARWWPVPYAALTAVLFLEQDARQQGLTVLGAVLLVALCVPLAWQRDRPLEAFVAAMVLYVITAASPVDTSALTAVFLVIFGPLFCVGRFEPPRRGLVGLLAAVVALPISAALEPPFDPSIFVTIPFFVLPAYLVGRVVRSRSGLVAELAEVNATIEREQAEAEAAAAAAERARVARELHDVVAHALSVMVIQAARGAAGDGPPARGLRGGARRRRARRARRRWGRCGRLLGVLRDDQDGTGRRPGPPRADGRARPRGRPAPRASRSTPRAGSLPATVDLAAFRIAQEAVTNAVKHAAPTDGRLCESTSTPASSRCSSRTTDGRAARGPGPGTGHGLLGMRERVGLHGGGSRPARGGDGGFRVCAPTCPSREHLRGSCSSTTRRSCARASA